LENTMPNKEIVIPSLADVDAEHADLIERTGSLNARMGEIRREISEVESAIAAERTTAGPRLRSAVAELTGDADAAAVDRRKELRELRQAEHDHSEALDVIQRRIYDRRQVASRLVIEAIRPEVNKRVSAVVAALETAIAARRDIDELIRALEREGVETDAFAGSVLPFFMGDVADGAAVRYVKAQREAGNA
jgi:prefoldin subunit 5